MALLSSGSQECVIGLTGLTVGQLIHGALYKGHGVPVGLGQDALALLLRLGPGIGQELVGLLPGGLLLLPTFLQGEGGWGFTNILIPAYQLAGFRPKHRFTRRSYREMIDGCGLGRADYILVKGRLPAGLAVLQKP